MCINTVRCKPNDHHFFELATYIPLIGTLSGGVAGMGARYYYGMAAEAKNSLLYRASCKGWVRMLNDAKQLEIKKCSLFLPFLPLFLALSYSTFQQWRKDQKKSLPTHLLSRIKQIPRKVALFTAHALAISFLVNGILSSAPFKLMNTCDPSGHFILKIVLSQSFQATSLSAKKIAKAIDEKRVVFFACAIGATDAIFLYHTSLYCHSVTESLLGMGIGIGICLISRVTSTACASILDEQVLEEREG